MHSRYDALFKNIRNNIELCKLQRKTNAGRCLFLENNYVVWKHWAESFNYNRFSIYRKSTVTPASKMRNELAIQVLNKDMLYPMKAYQSTLKNPENLMQAEDL